MFFSQTLEHLLDSESPFKPSTLYGLSRLEAEEMEQLIAAWPTIPITRRRKLIRELARIVETNFEVDYDPIFRWGLQDSDPKARTASVEGLWENEEPALMTEFLQLVQLDSSTPVRAAAALALGRFMLLSELETLPFEFCQPAYETLCAIVQDETETLEVRCRALEAVAYIGNQRISTLLQDAYDDPDDNMRASAIFGMGRSADDRWIDTVIQELFDPNPHIRYEATRACGELEARAATSSLAALIGDPDREVQESALWALGKIGGDEARRLLKTCRQEQDEGIRSAAEAALVELELTYDQLDFPFHTLGQADDVGLDPLS